MSLVFLICTERSGSNFITSVMNGHTKVSGPPPSHIFRLFGLNCQNYHPSENDDNWQAFLSDFKEATKNMLGDWDSKINIDQLNKSCPNKTIAEALDYLYQLERKPQECISFVKENYTYSIISFILANWPDAKFVYQVRDPRDVAASWLKTSTMPGGVKTAIDNWKKDQIETLNIFGQLQSSKRAILVRYEDMISDTEKICLKLCEYIGVKYEESMLEFYNDERTCRNAARIPAWDNLAKPVMKDNSGNYKKTLSTADIRYIELMCGSQMKVFGYTLDTDVDGLSVEQVMNEVEQLQSKISQGEKPIMDSKMERTVRSKRLALINRVKTRISVV